MPCPKEFNVNDNRLVCHRPLGHDGKHRAILDRRATIHWHDPLPHEDASDEAHEFVAASQTVPF